MNMEQMIFFVVLLVVFPCVVWGISRLFSKKNVELTGRATVRAHRDWLERGRKYLVCFELSDGSILQLRTVKGDYQTLKDGQSGQLT